MRGLLGYLNFYAADFPKSTFKYVLHPRILFVKTPYFGVVVGQQHTQIM